MDESFDGTIHCLVNHQVVGEKIVFDLSPPDYWNPFVYEEKEVAGEKKQVK